MSFDAREISNAGGTPTKLYHFFRSSGGTMLHWRYTSAQEDINVNGETWSAAAIEDEGVQVSGDAASEQVTIKVDSAVPFAKLFLGTPPSGVIYCNVWDTHVEEPTDRRLAFPGTVGGVGREELNKANIVLNSLLGSLRRRGARKQWSRGCSNVLYDKDCTLNPNDWSVLVYVTAVNGYIVTTDNLAAFVPAGQQQSFANGGWVEYADLQNIHQRRAVSNQDFNNLVMLGPTDGIVPGMLLRVTAGCRYNRDDCVNKFGNIANYGGAPDQPGKSPFDGTIVF